MEAASSSPSFTVILSFTPVMSLPEASRTWPTKSRSAICFAPFLCSPIAEPGILTEIGNRVTVLRDAEIIDFESQGQFADRIAERERFLELAFLIGGVEILELLVGVVGLAEIELGD